MFIQAQQYYLREAGYLRSFKSDETPQRAEDFWASDFDLSRLFSKICSSNKGPQRFWIKLHPIAGDAFFWRAIERVAKGEENA